MAEKRKARSDSYQYMINEMSFDMQMMSQLFDLDNAIHKQRSNRCLELNDQMFQRIIDLANIHTTPYQNRVMYLYLEGKTQMEIAKEIGVNQSSVTKCLMGNADYNKGKKMYGGLAKKMKKVIKKDTLLKQIAKEISLCDDLLYNSKEPNKVFCQTNYCCSTNIYFMLSTLFDNHDQYLEWMDDVSTPI